MDRHRSASPGTPAPYGHACVNCAQSKLKCIIRRAGEPCERCRRLNKECRPAETIRRRSSRKPAVSKTAQLEEKLDSLVSLIKAGAQSGAVITSPHITAAIDDSMPGSIVRIKSNTPSHERSERGSVLSSSSDSIQNVQVMTPATDDGTGSSYNLSISGSPDTGGEPSPVEAEEYLINFQTYKLRYFPFIYIPSTTSAQQLRQERPFLWLCIMAVGSRSTLQQQTLGSKIRQRIAQEIVIQSEKSIDLLLGLLTFIGWAHYQVHSKPFLAVFTQLAMSLVFELRLNKPISKDTQVIPCAKEKYSKPPAPQTMEERRAVLGCFLITSIISLFLQKIDALSWTPHMEDCLRIIDERKECLNDEIFVQQIRLQLIVEKLPLGTLHDGATASIEHIGELPSLHLETLHSQLQDVKTKLLAQPQTDKAVFLHLYSAGLELPLSPTLPHSNQLMFQQRKYLNASLESIKSWFDVFFTITPAAYIGFPFSIFSQLVRCVRCLITLYQLTALGDPSWNENHVWGTADLLLILDRVIANLEQVAILAGLDNSDSPERDVFSRTALMFRSLRPGLEAKPGLDDLSTITIPRNVNETFPVPQNINEPFSIPQNVSETFPPDTLAVDFDDDWLMDLLLVR